MATLGFGAGCGAGSSFTACRHSFQTRPPSGGSGGAGGAGNAGGKLAKDIAKDAEDTSERLRTAGGGAGEITRDVDTKPRGVRPPTARTPQEMRDAWANRKGS